MRPPSYMRSVFDRNVAMRRISVVLSAKIETVTPTEEYGTCHYRLLLCFCSLLLKTLPAI